MSQSIVSCALCAHCVLTRKNWQINRISYVGARCSAERPEFPPLAQLGAMVSHLAMKRTAESCSAYRSIIGATP